MANATNQPTSPLTQRSTLGIDIMRYWNLRDGWKYYGTYTTMAEAIKDIHNKGHILSEFKPRYSLWPLSTILYTLAELQLVNPIAYARIANNGHSDSDRFNIDGHPHSN